MGYGAAILVPSFAISREKINSHSGAHGETPSNSIVNEGGAAAKGGKTDPK